jgi:glyceraldehyde 3-phosphate dehydrogenase
MGVRIAVNGMGRIGRCVVRALLEEQARYGELELVAVNSSAPPETQLHLLAYDSVHGRLNVPVRLEEGGFSAGETGLVRLYRERNPVALPWGDLGVDVVLECTGSFNDRKAAAAHLDAGARKVVISAPAADADLTMVYGVNHRAYDPQTMRVVSAASCTTNCLAPLVKTVNDAFGIECGHMTTIHSYTGDQNLVDGTHKDLRRARAAACSMIPTSTGAAKAIGLVLPELDGKLQGTAVRVPTPNVSLVDLTCALRTDASAASLREAFRAAANGMDGVLGINEAPLVSTDFSRTEQSCIVDADSLVCVSPRFIRVAAWYDNEWAFSLRMLDLARHVASR